MAEEKKAIMNREMGSLNWVGFCSMHSAAFTNYKGERNRAFPAIESCNSKFLGTATGFSKRKYY
ncbi:hypothetical protein EBX31_07325 [bacterium]|nr:hypothetical protein [bacterium]